MIYDTNGVELAWNAPAAIVATSSSDANAAGAPVALNAAAGVATSTASSSPIVQNYGDGDEDVPTREYADIPGIAHTVGYVQYPSKDSAGFYYREDFTGMAGAEQYFDAQLQGDERPSPHRGRCAQQGAVGETPCVRRKSDRASRSPLIPASRARWYNSIKDTATKVGFSGGGRHHHGRPHRRGHRRDQLSRIRSGGDVGQDGLDGGEVVLNNSNRPFLDRVSSGLYTPGSIVKPYMALAALDQHIIAPTTIIQGTASISIQNPYNPSQSTLFRDWQAQGPEDMYKAIQESSDVYFYEIGGGYKDQKGLGISNIDKYHGAVRVRKRIAERFVLYRPRRRRTVARMEGGNFDGEDWYLGDTYHSAIGQYGWQVTPAQVIRAVASIANGGHPHQSDDHKRYPGNRLWKGQYSAGRL